MKSFIIILLCVFGTLSVRAQILVEVYRNIDCANCRAPDDGLELYVSQNPLMKITTVYFHADFPSPVDPFYLASQTDVSHRFYDVYQQSSTPYASIDGFVAGTNLTSWKNFLGHAPAPTATVSASMTDTNGILTIVMKVDGTGAMQVRPGVMLLESGIVYDNTKSYGKVIPTWDNIFRQMIPTKDGGDPFSLSGTHTFTYKVDVSSKGYDETNLSVVAFVQDVSPQPTPNTTSYWIRGFSTSQNVVYSAVPVATTLRSALGAPSPNPAQSSVSIPFTLTSSAQVKITVGDELGREVATIADGTFSEGNNSAVFAPAIPRPGLYVVTMSVNGVLIGSKKIILR